QGKELNIKQEDIKLNRHSIECRINSEDVLNSFMPVAGKIDFINIPGGNNVRFDTYLYNGCKISPFYDSMVGKLIVSDTTRSGAIKKLKIALKELKISGINTNIVLQDQILSDEEFIKGNYNTS